MAKLDIELDTEKFEALDETLKPFYVLNADKKYELDGVGSIKRAHKTDKEKYKAYEGLNPEEARKAIAFLQSIGEDVDAETVKEALSKKKTEKEKTLVDKNDKDAIEAYKKQLKDENEDKQTKIYKPLETKYNGLLQRTADKDLQLLLRDSGVRDDMAEDLAIILKARHIEPVQKGDDIVWVNKNNIGDVVDFETLIPTLKETKPDYFKPDIASGSGASGSHGNGGGARKWEELSRSEKSAAIREANGDTDAAKKKYS